ncbi:MAG TPA: FG-GAP-like repeat-containing protein, partial [Woeseiaceae bacterium]|nr:FG-GAP-like repeat-containing protein [Woeseiaceae bacterium]
MPRTNSLTVQSGFHRLGTRCRRLAMACLSVLFFAGVAEAAVPVASGVTISGNPAVGSPLTGNYAYSDADGDAEGGSVYRWYRYDATFCFFRVAELASTRDYTPTGADQGSCLSFEVTPVSQSGPPEERTGAAVESAKTSKIAAQNFPPTASNVTISGTTEVGYQLTGNYSYSDVNGDAQGASTFRWLRNGAPIAGATLSTYTLVAADQGTSIVFEVTPVALTGASPGAPVQSQGVGPIKAANTPPVASGVTIAGTLEVGFTLTGSYAYNDADGDAQGNSLFRWLRNDVPITGATTTQYVLAQADINTRIRFEVTPVAVSGLSPGVAVQSAPSEPIRPANTAPVASGVTITGSGVIGATLTGNYVYSDADGDVEGASQYRWLRNNAAIAGATTRNYAVVAPDVGANLQFEVTPVAATGVTPGAAVRSPVLPVNNRPPVITGQSALATPEDTPLTLKVSDFEITDPDMPDPSSFTLLVRPAASGANYTAKGNTITPKANFNGSLTVPVVVSDGFSVSDVFNAIVTVTAVNDPPRITGQQPDPLLTEEDTALTIDLANVLQVEDPDNSFPDDFTMALQEGENYTFAGNVVTPAEDFNGNLRVGVIVTDPEGASSNIFQLRITVSPVNDQPTLAAEIEDVTAVEKSPFSYDISGNFDDVDGDPLTYTATWSPQQPPNLVFDTDTGVFSGTPQFEDTDVPNSTYTVSVTAADPSGEIAGDTFQLLISALDRANLALDVVVTPETGQPGDELRWAFTASNPIGPQAGANVELTGSFIAPGLTVIPDATAVCTVQPEVDQATDFRCTIGALPVDTTSQVILTTVTSEVSDVLVSATAQSADALPIDPNLADNLVVKAVGVGLTFSFGAVQNVGSIDAHAIDAGDINGDGVTDIVVGTAAGQPVQIFFADAPRESCNCQRDFAVPAPPVSIPNTGNNEGVALGDVDNNGTLDLVIATGDGQNDLVYSNDGSGNFTLLATLEASFAEAVALADFNNDGNLDIVIAALGPNLVYLGDGAGGFALELTLGEANSMDVAVARIDNDDLPDIVFANTGSKSAVWMRDSAGGFARAATLGVGDTSSVAAGDLNADGRADLVFGRVTSTPGDVPSNPVFLNNGSGKFGKAAVELGFAPTYDVLIGDVNRDGLPDLVFINASGVHQIWTSDGAGFVLHGEQIFDSGARAGKLGDFGETAEGESGGPDLIIGGAAATGVGVYLNDGSGNLGRGDVEPPTLTLLGATAMEVAAGSQFTDPGASAIDNIDGDISSAVAATDTVNTAIVGSYTVTYNVTDFAGNPAAPVSRTVKVLPASGAGGGGGGGGA